MRSPVRPVSFAALSILVALALAGCSTTGMDRSVVLATEPVTAISVGDQTMVPAYDLADAMLRAGFSREEVLQHGPAIHSALATSGGAQVRQGKAVSAIFAVYGERLYVTSLARGTFVIPLGIAVAG